MIPRHIGIIMDGNRRFSRELLKLASWRGHEFGVKKARDVLEWACERGIKYMTTYALSLENFKSRSKKEMDMILKIFSEEADMMLNDSSHPVNRFNVNVKFIGRMGMFKRNLQDKLRKVELFTKNNKKHFLNIAVAYGGQQEIADATKDIVQKVLKGVLKSSDLNEDVVKKHLYTNGQPYPDLIIRTGGEKRLSNFLAFQSAYSELIFLDTRWPNFSKQEFDECLEEFSNRRRRFGA